MTALSPDNLKEKKNYLNYNDDDLNAMTCLNEFNCHELYPTRSNKPFEYEFAQIIKSYLMKISRSKLIVISSKKEAFFINLEISKKLILSFCISTQKIKLGYQLKRGFTL